MITVMWVTWWLFEPKLFGLSENEKFWQIFGRRYLRTQFPLKGSVNPRIVSHGLICDFKNVSCSIKTTRILIFLFIFCSICFKISSFLSLKGLIIISNLFGGDDFNSNIFKTT